MGLETIWTDYSAGLRRYLSMRLSDPDDVEDVPQTVLIKTHATLPDLGEVRNLRAWLTRVARNAAVDFHPRKGRADPHPDDLWYHDDSAPEDPGLDRCVRPFLAALPAEQGALLTAIDLNGQSQKAFAAQHGLAYSTVKSRVQAARSALRALLKLISFTICPFGSASPPCWRPSRSPIRSIISRSPTSPTGSWTFRPMGRCRCWLSNRGLHCLKAMRSWNTSKRPIGR